MSERLVLMAVRGMVSVSYREVEGEWHATALQFDLVGIGKTREKAFRQLRALVGTYLEAYAETKGKAQLFNWAEEEDRNNPDQKTYRVMALMVEKPRAKSPVEIQPEQLWSYRHRIKNYDLTPVLA
jgi:predicted RNase H-like HicB family nuclease